MGRKIQIRTAHRCASKVACGVFAPSALRYPKRTSRCSLARSFRPLRVLRLAASATGGARLRTPYPSPAAGEGPPIPITACSAYSLGSVTFCYWFAVVPNKIRRRHLESVSAALYGRCQASFVSSRSLAVRGSWGTAPSMFWYGAPGGMQGPPGKGGAAERWRVTPSVSGVTRHGAQPATTRTYKSRAPAASRTGFAPRRRQPPIWLKNSFSHFSS